MVADLRSNRAAVFSAGVAVVTWVSSACAKVGVRRVVAKVGVDITDVERRGIAIIAVGIGCAAVGVSRERWHARVRVLVAEVERAHVAICAVTVDVTALGDDVKCVAATAADAAVKVAWVAIITLGIC